MQNFDSIKNKWQQAANEKAAMVKPFTINQATAGTKIKLQNQQLGGAVMLLLTAALIGGMAIWGNFNFRHWYTYFAMGLVCAVCLIQAAILYFTWQKLTHIDAVAAPAAHLNQWENYYQFRKKQAKWNMPLYFIFLNMALGIYMAEILTMMTMMYIVIFLTVYIAWMLFAYFYLGKRKLKKEQVQLEGIIHQLKIIEGQLQDNV